MKSDLGNALYKELENKELTSMYGEFRYHINERMISEVWDNEEFENLLNSKRDMEWYVQCDKVNKKMYKFTVYHIGGFLTKTFIKE